MLSVKVQQITDTASKRVLRVDLENPLNETTKTLEEHEWIRIRVEIERAEEWEPETYYLEALQKARTLLAAEIERMRSPKDQSGASLYRPAS